jgi:hypothetical protein
MNKILLHKSSLALLGLLDVGMSKRGSKQLTCICWADMSPTCRLTCWQHDTNTVGGGIANVGPTCHLLTCQHRVGRMLDVSMST